MLKLLQIVLSFVFINLKLYYNMYISEKGKCNQWQKFIGLHFRTMSEGEEIQAMEIQEDVVLKEYNFKKWNGKILTRVTYDLKKNQKELLDKKQLKLW